MEFVAKQKLVKVTVNGTAYEMKMPTIGERRKFYEVLKNAQPEDSIEKYTEFFESLGLPRDAIDSMDGDDFISFIEFVTNPKKKQVS